MGPANAFPFDNSLTFPQRYGSPVAESHPGIGSGARESASRTMPADDCPPTFTGFQWKIKRRIPSTDETGHSLKLFPVEIVALAHAPVTRFPVSRGLQLYGNHA